MVLAGESAVALGYFVLTESRPNRPVLVALATVAAVVALGAIPLVRRIARQSWRSEFVLGAGLVSGVVLTACIFLDNGLHSPLIFLLALPIANAALALPVRAVAICGIATLVELGAIAISNPSIGRSGDELTMLAASVVGLVVLALGWVTNRSQLEVAEARLLAELTRLAQTDALTGCLNHGAFFERLDGEIDRALRHDEPLSLLMADVDLFKAFNDFYGHVAGDHALAVLGSALRHSSRSFDVAGRVGGDEFAVILPATSFASAAQIAKRMTCVLEHPNGVDINVSIGFATLDRREPTSKRLFRDADAGLYQAKANGRGGEAPPPDLLSWTTENDERRAPSGTDAERADRKRNEETLRAANHATAEALAILATIEATSTVGFGFIDRDLRIIRLNPMLAAVNGGRLEDQIGCTVQEVVPLLWPTLEPVYRSVLDLGEAVLNVEVTGELASDPGHRRDWLSSFYPVKVGDDIIGIAPVVIDVTDHKRLEESQTSITRAIVRALAGAVEMRDPYTAGHQARVARLAVAIATALELDAGEIGAIGLAASIHDLGKLAIPTEILSRPGRLSDAEMALVREHAQAGSDMLERVNFPDEVREMILQHHERLDGSGYPRGLRGEQISIGSRIIAVADVAEAITSHRPYRPAAGLDVAVKELQAGAGRLYDTDAVSTCLRILHEGFWEELNA